jgi:hypothetical protein
LEESDLRRYASELGLDLETFDVDRSSEKVFARVRRDVDSGLASGECPEPGRFSSTASCTSVRMMQPA